MVVRRDTSRRDSAKAALIPRQFVIGLLILLVVWPLAWSGIQPWSWYTFFPLWLGYILTVDGLVQRQTGTSLLTRSRREFALLFLASAPLWWVFELFNLRLANWSYAIPFHYTRFEYVLLGSIAFSTVIPAIFETAELYRSFPRFQRALCWKAFLPGPHGSLITSLAGMVMATLVLVFPEQAFPLVWVSVFFLIDPINRKLGLPNITGQTAQGRWDTVVVLVLSGLTCGFFWEMWNYWSEPKWAYSVPIFDFAKVFEMPIFGYLGYIPFALEVYTLYHLIGRFLGVKSGNYVQFDQAANDARNDNDAVPNTRT